MIHYLSLTRAVRLCVPAAIAVAMLAGARPAQSQTFKTLYAFTGGADGGTPWATPLLSGGVLYEPTFTGGLASSNGAGTVFQYDTTTNRGTYLYQFGGEPYDGSAAMGALITDGFGDFWGTTTQGGFGLAGTLYEISGGTEFVIQNFNGADGSAPEGNLILDPVGDLFGTTSNGGNNDCGTIFAFSAVGSFLPLYNFGDYSTDGIAPVAGLVFSKSVLYGVTTEGGKQSWGTIFGVNVKTHAETQLYNFTGKRDGGTPVGGLVPDGQGNLYGTASVGGSNRGNAGNGVIFKFNIASSTYTTLYRFAGPDGKEPLAALLPDGQGNFYGTTYAGGAKGYGTVFKFNSATNTLTTLYSFTNGTDGAYPYGGLAMDAAGDLYGAATHGGQFEWGTLFEIVQ